jgi:hypothetical protein
MLNHKRHKKKKHDGAYIPFQYKLWAEMYTSGCHCSLEDPPAASMFNREKQTRGSHVHTQTDLIVSVIDRLCSTLTPNRGKEKAASTLALSPMKRAELRSTNIKQLGELKSLNENAEGEYKEQREDY